MHHLRLIVPISAALSLVSCGGPNYSPADAAPGQQHDESAWVGHNAQELVSKVGEPDYVYPLSSGGRTLEFDYPTTGRRPMCGGFNGNTRSCGMTPTQGTCTRNFDTDASGRITATHDENCGT